MATTNIQSFSGKIEVNGTTPSSSKTTGALTVAGGVGVTSNIHASNLFASDYVAIGTTSPGQKLEVGHYGGALSSDLGAIRITNHATNLHATSLARFDISLGDIGSNTGSGKRKLIFNSKTTTTDSGTDILCLDGQTNNVGIGTDSPRQKLEVANGSIAIVQNNYKNGADDDQFAGKIDFHLGGNADELTTPVAGIEAYDKWTGGSYFGALAFKTMNSEKMRIATNGNVGIGTANPEASLHVQGARSIFGNNGGASDIVINDVPTARWKIATGGYALIFSKHNSASDEYSTWSEKVRIDQNGNVGIGTDSPTAQLTLGASSGSQIQVTNNTRLLSNTHYLSYTSGTSDTFEQVLLQFDTGETGSTDQSEYAGYVDVEMVAQRTQSLYLGPEIFTARLNFILGWNEQADLWRFTTFIQENKGVSEKVADDYTIFQSVPVFKYKYVDRQLQIYVSFDANYFRGYTSFTARVTSDNVADVSTPGANALMASGTVGTAEVGICYGVGTNAANVGIGTTNPSSNLHVNGDVYVSSNLEVGTANLFVDTQTGNVGIGTVSPQGLLHISSGTSGDAHLILEADTDNNNESDNPKIVFRQDGGYYTGEIGLTDNRMVFRSKSTTTGNTGFIFYSNVAPGQTSKTDLDDLEDTQVEVMRIDGDGNVGIGTTNPTSNLHVVGNALITGLTYAIKSTGTLGSDKTEDWYRLLVGNNRGGSNAIRTKCKLQLVAAGLHQVLTFDFNHMINLSETSGNSFNLLGNDHYISRVGIIKLRLADIGSNQVALDMYIDHNVVDVNRVWTVTLYTEGGSLISEASTFLEKITTTPTTSIELSTDTSIFGIVGNTTGKHVVVSEDGNVGIGTTNPVGVNGGRRLEGSSSTGFGYIATRDDTSGVTGDFVGAYLFKNPDTDGSPPHYAGMSAKISGTNGPMDLRFYTNRDKYEDDDPKMIIESSGDVGIGTDNPAYTLDVNGTSNAATYYQNGVELYAQRRWEVDLTGQSSANFYPVELKHPTYEGSPDLPDMFPVHFKVFGESLAGADSYNENTLVGYARGGGYSDHDEMYDVHYRRYSGGINEKRFEGLYQGTTNYAEGIVIYMRGGYRYSVLTDATEVNTYTSATTLGEAVFAIKDVDGDDVSGTSANISRLVHLAGNEGERRFMSGILNITYSTASTSKTTGALTVSGGLGVASNIHTSNLFASNFVGIGVTSPETALHVLSSDSSTSNQTLKLENPYVFAFNVGRDIGSSIVFKNRWQGDGINDPIDMVTIEGRKEQNANYGDSYISFKTRYETDRGNGGAGTLTEKMRITGNGNVGIGTT